MDASNGQTRYLARKLKRLRTELMRLFPSMSTFNASIKVRGIKSMPVIEITWSPGYGLTKEKRSKKLVQQFNEGWQDAQQKTLKELPEVIRIPRGKHKTLTSYSFRHKAGEMEL